MTLACALLTLLYVGLEVCAVRPYLWPAGTGASIAADPATRIPLFARPPRHPDTPRTARSRRRCRGRQPGRRSQDRTGRRNAARHRPERGTLAGTPVAGRGAGWLHCTGAALLVPVLTQERGLIAVIVLGERRSDEAYTDEDRELLASIAAQTGLGFDAARVHRRAATDATPPAETTRAIAVTAPMMECPRCGRCEEANALACPATVRR
jgi:hypothetical protein